MSRTVGFTASRPESHSGVDSGVGSGIGSGVAADVAADVGEAQASRENGSASHPDRVESQN
jgi:hypothetical protein